MSVWILTKKKIAAAALLFIASVGALCLSLNTLSAAISGNIKKMPVYSVETDSNDIALTFNAAWGNEDIPELLSIFDGYGIKVTFFFVGDWVEKYPDSVKAIFDAGHCIANHSYSHPDMVKLSEDEIYADIKKCNELIREVTGVTPLYFRPPSGSYDNKTLTAAEKLNMMTIQWDTDSLVSNYSKFA